MKISHILIIISCIILFSCNTPSNKGNFDDVSSLSLFDLANNYEKSRSKTDLKIYLQRIDTMLAKDHNVLTYENIGLAELKLNTLTFNYVDTTNILIVDSLCKRIFSFYKDMAKMYPSNPRIYIDLAKMYNYPKMANIDSVYFYYEKTLLLCDSILEKVPYEEVTYRTKIYTLLTLGREEEAKEIIEKDKKSTTDKELVLTFLTELSKELEL